MRREAVRPETRFYAAPTVRWKVAQCRTATTHACMKPSMKTSVGRQHWAPPSSANVESRCQKDQVRLLHDHSVVCCFCVPVTQATGPHKRVD